MADVDSALGHLHNRTLTRQEIEDYVMNLRLSEVKVYEDIEADSDPMERGRIKQLDGLIRRVIQRAAEASDSIVLKKRGEELRERLHELGAQREPILLVLGKK